MSDRKQPTPVPPGAIKPNPPPAPPRLGPPNEIEEALRQLVDAMPDLYDEVMPDTMDAVRHAQRVLGIEVEPLEEATYVPPRPTIWVDGRIGRDFWWRSGAVAKMAGSPCARSRQPSGGRSRTGRSRTM